RAHGLGRAGHRRWPAGQGQDQGARPVLDQRRVLRRSCPDGPDDRGLTHRRSDAPPRRRCYLNDSNFQLTAGLFVVGRVTDTARVASGPDAHSWFVTSGAASPPQYHSNRLFSTSTWTFLSPFL